MTVKGTLFMKKTLWLLSLVVLLLVTGCSGKWHHPTKIRSEWGPDHSDCERIVRESIREAPDAYSAIDELKLIKTCMKKKGWKR